MYYRKPSYICLDYVWTIIRLLAKYSLWMLCGDNPSMMILSVLLFPGAVIEGWI